MNVRSIVSIILLAAVLPACNRGDNRSGSAADVSELDSAARAAKVEAVDAVMPEIVNGVQVVHVAVQDTGYIPSRIRFKQGIPARIVFDQHSKTECASQVEIPSMNVGRTDLPEGKQTAVEFTPSKSGEFTFTCGMKMLEGTILVGS
jgi:plastocyanin domain-containing protein